MTKKKGLGKGLDALLPDWDAIEAHGEGFYRIDPREIRPNPYQPRKYMDEESLRELAVSIKEKGVIQPLIIRSAEDGYELVAGERRLRAALMASLESVPVIVKDLSPAEMLEIALIENIQREELNALEEADAYARLIDEFGLTQEKLSERVGKKRATIANYLRLRKLPDPIKENLLTGSISMGHARALLSLESRSDMIRLRDEIVKRDLSVRAAERKANQIKKGAETARKPAPDPDPYLKEISQRLSEHYGYRVIVTRNEKKGAIQFEFYSDDDLERLLELLKG